MADHHTVAKDAHKSWVLAGRPREGPVLDSKKLTYARFKYAVRYVKKHEQAMKADSMAEKLMGNDTTGFWKEVRALSRGNTSLPNTIEGVSGANSIVELWKQHYSKLFNCIKNDPFVVGDVSSDEAVISAKEVHLAISQLADNKASGSDSISAEHLKHAGPRLAVLLALSFTAFMSHGILPNSMLSVTLVPVIKDKAGRVGSLDNYRPIALASVVSKVLEIILLDRFGSYLYTSDNQFGFKPKLSTDQCIFALKEMVDTYKRANSSVLLGFIDASKAFDRVNHQKLFMKLRERGVPETIIRILAFWYANQRMQVRWGSAVSAPFSVGNGVRQGGIISPVLFNLYMNGLSDQLRECNTGCMVGNTVVNHLMYADDLVIVSPSSAGFQQLLHICSQYGVSYDVQYNAKKSVILICRTKGDKDLNFPPFFLSGQTLSVCSKTKYLGHIITDRLLDDDDMYRQRRMLLVQANILARRFHWCSDQVKFSLFRSYCTPLYTAPLWVRYKKESFHKLKVAYNDCFRILLNKPRWSSASDLFCSAGISTFAALLRHLMYKFLCRLNVSKNSIIQLLINPKLSSVRYGSCFWTYWYECLVN